MACFLGAGAILIVLLFVMGDALLAATAAVGIHSTGRGRSQPCGQPPDGQSADEEAL
jgi:hypothetical protein